MLFSIPFSISDLVNENKATSAPEIKAEQIKRTKSNITPASNEVSIAERNTKKLEGSGSKLIVVS